MKQSVRDKLAASQGLARPIAVVDEVPQEPPTQLTQFAIDQAERLAARQRLAQLDAEEKAARDAQITASHEAITKQDSRPKFTEGQYKPDPSRSIHLPPKTAKALAAEVRPALNRSHVDPYAHTLPPSQRSLYGIEVEKLEVKPSLVLPSKPAKQGSWQPRGADAPLTGTELREAELQQRPEPAIPEYMKKVCEKCGDVISKATAFHKREDGTICVVPGNEAYALKEGIAVAKQ